MILDCIHLSVFCANERDNETRIRRIKQRKRAVNDEYMRAIYQIARIFTTECDLACPVIANLCSFSRFLDSNPVFRRSVRHTLNRFIKVKSSMIQYDRFYVQDLQMISIFVLRQPCLPLAKLGAYSSTEFIRPPRRPGIECAKLFKYLLCNPFCILN